MKLKSLDGYIEKAEIFEKPEKYSICIQEKLGKYMKILYMKNQGNK